MEKVTEEYIWRMTGCWFAVQLCRGHRDKQPHGLKKKNKTKQKKVCVSRIGLPEGQEAANTWGWRGREKRSLKHHSSAARITLICKWRDNPAAAYEYFRDLKGPSVPRLLALSLSLSLSLTHTLTHSHTHPHTHTHAQKKKYRFVPPR